jgi:hypothetical protein
MPRPAAVFVVALLAATPLVAQTADGPAAFAMLSSLVGDWTGTAVWTGSRTDTYPLNAHYSLTGHGSAVVEDLGSEGPPAMTSVYHLDGPDLRMTHYCGARNQPRLRATRYASGGKVVDFEFVDITNLQDANAPHVDGLRLELRDDRHLTLVFHFRQGEKISEEHIALERAGTR